MEAERFKLDDLVSSDEDSTLGFGVYLTDKPGSCVGSALGGKDLPPCSGLDALPPSP